MSDAAHFDEPAGAPPETLWARLFSDPLRAPEHVALAASERHAPAAAAWADRRRRVYGTDGPALAQMARRRHAGLASAEGAATGVGGLVTLIPDLLGLAWIQSRMVFYIAAAYGFDPRDRMRPAELLVINGLYPDPVSARAALDGVGVTVANAYLGNRLARDETLMLKLAKMVGKSSGKKFAGRAIPGFAIVFNSIVNRRDTNALARRAISFYGG